MALEQKLSLKLAQKLVMTPSLQQAIKLLQMTKLELETVVTEELVENPMLERLEDGDDEPEVKGVDEPSEAELEGGEGEAASEAGDDAAATEDAKPEESAAEPQAENAEGEASENTEADTESEDLQSLDDIDIDAYFNDYLDGSGSTAASTFEMRDAAPLENTVSATPELADHLLWQIQMMDLSPQDREIAETVIGNLNEDGFLRASVEEIQLLGAQERERAAYQVAQARWQTSEANVEGADAAVVEGAQAPEASRERAGNLSDLERRSAEALPQAQRHVSIAGGGTMASGTTGGSSPVLSGAAANEQHLAAAIRMQRTDSEVSAADRAGPPEVPGYPRRAVEEAIALVQSLDPPGVGAVDLRESLLLQLRAVGEEETLAYELIENDWDRLLKRQFAAIAKTLGMPLADLEEPFERIKMLETRPGRRFGGGETQYVEPDVAVVRVGGEYVIQINDDGMPRLRVSKAYRRMLQTMRAEGRENDAQQYLREKMRSAMWLIKSLDQRQRTIYKVANSIVKQQQGFLDAGIEHLRPMVLRDVAEDIGMHESTVSRVVSNKYIHTPRGLFPMKFFFHSGIDSDQGEDISSLTVKRKLKNFIDGENPKKPLSDSALMRRLNAEGINIARRTVAKYRDELNIPSSTDRKQVF